MANSKRKCGGGGMKAGSWVVTCISSGEVFEFFDEANKDKAVRSGLFHVETAMEYLCRIAKQSKEERDEV